MTQVLQLFSVALLTLLVVNAACQKTYDFIVVGAGAGGGVITRRLVETGNFTVLLIEVGGWPKEGYDVPARTHEFYTDPDVTLQYQSVPQRNVALSNNGIVNSLAGKMLGGTTSLNAMWFNRGNPRDWDNWAKVTDDDTWRYDNMMKYFKRSEDYQGGFPSDQHGTGGPITVSRQKYAPGLNYWLRAGRELGYPVADSNGPQRISFAPVEFSRKRGRRISSLVGYLEPVWEMPNLQVLINTNVDKIIFQGNHAVGVTFVSNSTSDKVAYATKEVIICAGTFNSPLILQRSGIGLRNVLEPANIKIVRELPTGENFQNHPSVNLNIIVNDSSVVMDADRDLTPEAWQLYNEIGDGPWSNNRGTSGQALFASSVAVSEGNAAWPDIHFCMSHSVQPYVQRDNLHLTVRSQLRPGEVQMSTSVFIGRPKSRGSVHIDPDNVLGNPVIDAGYLTDGRDLQMFFDGVKESVRIFEQTNSYRSLGARYAPVALPACNRYPVKSDKYWVCYIKQMAQGGCHPAGTNKMGKNSDPTAVVDNKLRVIGMEGLRVVDASIMPFIVNTNPQAPVYAIAEKTADLILKRWGAENGSATLSNTFGHNNNNYLRPRHGWTSHRFGSLKRV